jgi:hypothetical protein
VGGSTSSGSSSIINNNNNIVVINNSNSNTFGSDIITNIVEQSSTVGGSGDESVLGSDSEWSVVPHVAPEPATTIFRSSLAHQLAAVACCLLIALLLVWSIRRKRRSKPSDNITGYFDGAASTQREVSSVEQQTCRDSSEDHEPAASHRFSSVGPATITDTDADADTSATASLHISKFTLSQCRNESSTTTLCWDWIHRQHLHQLLELHWIMDQCQSSLLLHMGSMPEKEND